MKWVPILCAFLMAATVDAQEKSPKKKKPVAAAHKKPTPDQIRKFDKLQKQKQREAKG
jgi:hypothetical protein